MKALIRNPGETVTEADGIEGIDWKTGMPLTNPVWAGGSYTLVNDYVPEDPDADFTPTDPTPASAPAQDPTPDIIVIDGKKYSKEELRSLLE